MKTRLTIFTVLLCFAVFSLEAQSKKEIEEELAGCKTTSASLQTELDGLTASFDSISVTYDSILLAYMVYDTMYTVIKEKVFMHEFNPADMSALIDTLRSGNEEAFSDITTALNDSISVLAEENSKMKIELEGMKAENDEEAMKGLKQLKELLDEEIITQEEFDKKKAVLLDKL